MKKLIILLLISHLGVAQEVAILKYSGGGDWYANPTSLPNLIQFCKTKKYKQKVLKQS